MNNKGTILAVDDTHASLKLLTDILTSEGYQVRPADSGELAIASVTAGPPDLILLDIYMPGMDGFAVLRWLKAQDVCRDIPVIFLSAATETKQRVEGLKLGAVDFISKPFQAEELLARVQTHLELRRIRVQLEAHAKMLQDEIVTRKKAEEVLREQSHVLNESQRLGHIGSWFFDRTGRISWSDELYRIYGVSPDTFTPTFESLLSLIHPDDRPAMQSWTAACEAGDRPGALDFRINMPDGTVRFIRGFGEAVFDAGNKLLYIAGLGQDITERRKLREALQQKVRALEKAMSEIKILSGLLPICSHCKKIRDEKGYWNQIDAYIMEHSDTEFSHGICDDCLDKMYPGQAKKILADGDEEAKIKGE